MSSPIREKQEARQKVFPRDRIAFYPHATYFDCVCLKNYVEGYIPFDELCKLIAENNKLDEYFPNGRIPEKMMRNELKLLGWVK